MLQTQSHLMRRLLAGTAATMLVAFAAGQAVAADPQNQAQRNVVNDQRIDPTKETPTSLTSIVEGRYFVDTGQASAGNSSLAVDGNQQSATAAGNTASTTLTAKGIRADGDSANDGLTPLSSLVNRQNANGAAKADTQMTVAVPGGITWSSVSLSDNANSALARMNDAANTATVEVLGVAGDHSLTSEQNAAGTVTATATTRIGGSSDATPIQASRYSVQRNATVSEATANRALNALSVTAVGVPRGNAVLDNRQLNDATVGSSAPVVLNVTGSGAPQSAITLDGNATTVLARGNTSDNRLTLIGALGADRGEGAPMRTSAFAVSAVSSTPGAGGATLTNQQTNNGAVTAETTHTASAALNCTCMQGSRVGIGNNTAAASAYGNAALNAGTVEGLGQTYALVSNIQVNRGPVAARVSGTYSAIMPAGIGASMVTVTGNSLAATAIGNQAVNAITASR